MYVHLKKSTFFLTSTICSIFNLKLTFSKYLWKWLLNVYQTIGKYLQPNIWQMLGKKHMTWHMLMKYLTNVSDKRLTNIVTKHICIHFLQCLIHFAVKVFQTLVALAWKLYFALYLVGECLVFSHSLILSLSTPYGNAFSCLLMYLVSFRYILYWLSVCI